MELPHWPNGGSRTRPLPELERERQERLIQRLGATAAWAFLGLIFFLVIVGTSTVVVLVVRGFRDFWRD